MTAAVVEQPGCEPATWDAAAAERVAVAERGVFRSVFAPRTRMGLLAWSEERRYLSPEANAMAADAGAPVRYSTSVTPYHREILRALSDPETEIVVCMLPSQDGKTELLNNFVGHRIDVEPGPMLVLQPTREMAETWSRDRLSPMLRDTPSLRGRVRDARSRDADNTILHKKFPGGHLTTVGSNSAAGLASRPIRDVLVDEVDRCARSAGNEGDSIRLAFRRATTFRRGKKLLISSPTVKGQSRIHQEYELGTQEEWHVPCPHCGEYQYLVWGGPDVGHGIKWDHGAPDESPHYVCIACAAVIEETHKAWMIANGRWVAQNPEAGGRRRSFRKNILTSNLVAWRKLVTEWLEVQGRPEELQQFMNTALCELFDPVEGEEVRADALYARRGVGYPDAQRDGGRLAERIAVLTRSVDVQGDRIETAVWGWGEGEEAWLVEYEWVDLDPGTPAAWARLDELRRRTYTTESGARLRPLVTFIDSGGHHAGEVYSYTRVRNRQGVYAIKGAAVEGAPLLSRPTRNNAARAILYSIGVFTAKESLMRRLTRVLTPGPRFIHLPEWLEDQYVEHFAHEVLETRVQKGGKRRRYWKQLGRNEMIDLYVYALAALHKLGPQVVRDLGRIAARRATPPDQPPDGGGAPPSSPPPAPPPAPRSPTITRGPRRPGGRPGGFRVHSW